MAKFYGMIGYSSLEAESAPGVWTASIEERPYAGDLIRNTHSMQEAGQVNDNLTIANEISILSDPYAISNFHSMRYVVFMGSKWKISKVEVRYPRLILTIGGVYNG